MKIDYTEQENILKKEIEEYFNTLKIAYNEEKVLINQVKDNLELIDFLNLPQISLDIRRRLDVAEERIKEACKVYHRWLKSKHEPINMTLSNLSEKAKYKDKIAIELRYLCDDLEEKMGEMDHCIARNPIARLKFWKNISTRKALKLYLKDFPKDSLINDIIRRNRKETFESIFVVFNAVVLVGVLISLLMWPIFHFLIKVSWAYIFGISFAIFAVIFFICIFILGLFIIK